MLIDTSQLSEGQALETDLCVIGAGAAGITIANYVSLTMRWNEGKS